LNSYAQLTSNVAIPASGTTYLRFDHAYGFENPDYDGGWLEYSVNGGAWTDAAGLYNSGQAYDGNIVSGQGNPSGGHIAFLGDSHGYVSTRYDLSSLAGSNVRVRFRLSTDNVIWDWGWFIDNVRIYTCGAPAPAASTWYLAEGYTGGTFDTFILLQNTASNPASVTASYAVQGGGQVTRNHVVPANARYTIVAQNPAELGKEVAFSTKIDADQSVIVERAMYYDNDGHAATGVRTPANTWYLAEGFTGGGFETFILIQNTAPVAASVTATYSIQGGGQVVKNHIIPANARYTIVAGDAGQAGPDQAFSTKIDADQPVIVERAMYYAEGAHAATGVTTPATTWYLAEGFTGGGFATFILIQNTTSFTASVTATYAIQGGGQIVKNHVVPPNARYTIAAHDLSEVGVDAAFSTLITSDRDIIVERAMYFPGGAHASTGIASPDTTWYLAEGYTGPGFGTFILLQNTSGTDANVTVTYSIQGGGQEVRNHIVPANSRYTIVTQDLTEVGVDAAFSTKIESDQPIIVERAMYFPTGGHNASGVTLP
jgi:hypothetical protein